MNLGEMEVMPFNDLIEHTGGEDCVCGPDSEVGFREGCIIIVHHSLDGREMNEREHE